MQLIGVLAIFAVILLVVWLLLKWMGGLQNQQLKNRNMQIMESIRVGGNKMISIVRVGTAYFVVAVGKDEIHPIARLDDEQISSLKYNGEKDVSGSESFSGILGRITEKTSKSRKGNE